jgi:hypothetical protein
MIQGDENCVPHPRNRSKNAGSDPGAIFMGSREHRAGNSDAASQDIDIKSIIRQ